MLRSCNNTARTTARSLKRDAHVLSAVGPISATVTPEARYTPSHRYRPSWSPPMAPEMMVPYLLLSASGGGPNGPAGHHHPDRPNLKRLNRKANLGAIIEALQLSTPGLLQKLLPDEIVSKDVTLRILPHQFPNLPMIKGYMLYTTTLKTLQLILTSFYLNPKTRLHISHVSVEEPTDSMSTDDLINHSLENNVVEKISCANGPSAAASNYTTRISVKWRTCLAGCPHLENSSTTSAKMGSYRFETFDIGKLLSTEGRLPSALLRELAPHSIKKPHKNLERTLSGVFIFELNSENDKVAVFTIDNLDIIERGEMELKDIQGGLAPFS